MAVHAFARGGVRSRRKRSSPPKLPLQLEQLEDRRLLSGGFRFTPIATIPGPAPGGGQLVNDFEPGGLNNRGEVAFVADVTPSGEEGVFLGARGGSRRLSAPANRPRVGARSTRISLRSSALPPAPWASLTATIRATCPSASSWPRSAYRSG